MMFVTEWRLALVSIGVTFLGMLLTVLILSDRSGISPRGRKVSAR